MLISEQKTSIGLHISWSNPADLPCTPARKLARSISLLSMARKCTERTVILRKYPGIFKIAGHPDTGPASWAQWRLSMFL